METDPFTYTLESPRNNRLHMSSVELCIYFSHSLFKLDKHGQIFPAAKDRKTNKWITIFFAPIRKGRADLDWSSVASIFLLSANSLPLADPSELWFLETQLPWPFRSGSGGAGARVLTVLGKVDTGNSASTSTGLGWGQRERFSDEVRKDGFPKSGMAPPIPQAREKKRPASRVSGRVRFVCVWEEMGFGAKLWRENAKVFICTSHSQETNSFFRFPFSVFFPTMHFHRQNWIFFDI